MATFEFQQSRFTEGVLARSLHGRSPEEFYAFGVHDAENMIPLLEGPMVKRPGTVHVADAKTSSSKLVPFYNCLLYTSPSPRDKRQSRMPSSA